MRASIVNVEWKDNNTFEFGRGKRYPRITHIYGVTETAIQIRWVTRYKPWGQIAAARGNFVFLPNYKAGSGRGVDFTMEGFVDLVGKEYEDVLDGIDFLFAKGYVDKDKECIGGGSMAVIFPAGWPPGIPTVLPQPFPLWAPAIKSPGEISLKYPGMITLFNGASGHTKT